MIFALNISQAETIRKDLTGYRLCSMDSSEQEWDQLLRNFLLKQ
jgi:hypothetical protein